MNKRARFAIAAFLLTGAVGYLMYSGVRQAAVYYLTIDEFLAKKESLANEGIRVAGRVEIGSVSKRMTAAGEELNFRLGDFHAAGAPTDGARTDGARTDGAARPTVPVHFVGVAPDMFKAAGGSDVIVEGKYRDGTLYAQSVLTSCPSKYEAEAGK
jgi:cytochrome c-type biogenesis protein CcmE